MPASVSEQSIYRKCGCSRQRSRGAAEQCSNEKGADEFHEKIICAQVGDPPRKLYG